MYQKPVEITKRKIIEVLALVLVLLWSILFIFNYVRYSNSKPLLLAIHKVIEYEDGYVNEDVSFGYIYRSYNRDCIKGEELVPFWVSRKNPEGKPNLPKVDTDYEVPDNIRRQDKYMGLLYFYNRSGKLMGTYKCINTVRDCNKAFGGKDYYDIVNKDPITALEEPHTLYTVHDKFAFVDDSMEQPAQYGDPAYERIIYLYKFVEKEEEILARFADIKESNFDEDHNVATGDGNKFIVKDFDSGKWGVINLKESGDIEQVLPYEYDSVNYDADTGYYILAKDNIWYVYNLAKNEKVSVDSMDPIYNVWRNTNMTYYFKTGRERTIGNNSFIDYKIFRIDGRQFLSTDRVSQIIERPTYVMYITNTDNVLHFMDYSGEEKYKYQLYFSEMHHTKLTNPAFKIAYEFEYSITLDIYEGRELSYNPKRISVNVRTWDND